MGVGEINRAVFLDRDGVINRNVLNPATGAWEAPKQASDFVLLPGVIDAMKRLGEAGFLLFLVSNQPDYAKGKATLEALAEVHGELLRALDEAGITFSAFYYCHHHPEGVVKGYCGPCPCRKPSPYFLLEAAKKFRLALERSWMVGDRETDVECGQRAGASAIRVALQPGEKTKAQFTAADLAGAVDIILRG
jgi:D-glycero-D-manno-heptose 1,7-bisphosphate phosphatase